MFLQNEVPVEVQLASEFWKRLWWLTQKHRQLFPPPRSENTSLRPAPEVLPPPLGLTESPAWALPPRDLGIYFTVEKSGSGCFCSGRKSCTWPCLVERSVRTAEGGSRPSPPLQSTSTETAPQGRARAAVTGGSTAGLHTASARFRVS